jgi:hypothetical protein
MSRDWQGEATNILLLEVATVAALSGLIAARIFSRMIPRARAFTRGGLFRATGCKSA